MKYPHVTAGLAQIPNEGLKRIIEDRETTMLLDGFLFSDMGAL